MGIEEPDVPTTGEPDHLSFKQIEMFQNCNIFVIKQYQYIKLVMKTVTWSLKIIPSKSHELAEEKNERKTLVSFFIILIKVYAISK